MLDEWKVSFEHELTRMRAELQAKLDASRALLADAHAETRRLQLALQRGDEQRARLDDVEAALAAAERRHEATLDDAAARAAALLTDAERRAADAAARLAAAEQRAAAASADVAQLTAALAALVRRRDAPNAPS